MTDRSAAQSFAEPETGAPAPAAAPAAAAPAAASAAAPTAAAPGAAAPPPPPTAVEAGPVPGDSIPDPNADAIDAADLMEFDAEFESAPLENPEYEMIPDGKYAMVIEGVEFGRSRAGNRMLNWRLRVCDDSEFAGRVVFRHSVILSSANLGWLKTDVHTCGVKITKLSELPARLPELLDVRLAVTVKSQGEFTNVYFNKRLSGADSPGAPAGEAGSALPAF